MKQFFKYVLATMVGVFALCVILAVMSIISLVGMAAMGSSATTTVKDNSVLVIKLDGQIDERATNNPFAALMGGSLEEPCGLDEIMLAIDHAKNEDKVKGIYIEAGSISGAAPATLQEIRNALVDFKKTGKFIMAYGDTYSQGTYYISSVADSLVINPQGLIEWRGLASQTMYYKDLFEKIGVSMQVVKVGTYKSAVEPFLLNEMSDANREQITVFEGEIWDQILADVSKSRSLKKEKLSELADSAIMFKKATEYKKEKLVDKLAYSDDVPSVIANMMKVDGPDDYSTITVKELASIASSEPKGTSGDIVAVYYAYGDIVEEASNSGFSQSNEIVGKKVIKELKDLADDDDVKAVVLRVNSGGGSAYASEQIWHQVMNIKAKKPIVVSMGDYAASGGYYISCAADWIVAQPTTLTGSIGIFGTFPEAGELLNNKLGVHFSTVKTNQYADFGDISRPLTEGERAVLQNYINNGYDLFTKRCADGRKMKQDAIKAIAEGRVWTGVHAKKIGLVDQLGSLEDAIAVAKKKAKLDDCSVITYPAKPDVFANLLDEMNNSGSYADAQMKDALGEYYNMFSNIKAMSTRTGVQASMPYYLMWNL